MIGTVLLSLAVQATPALLPSMVVVQDNPPIQVWLNKKDYVEFGDKVRVYVRSEFDGHMIVLHADPEGRVRVLYPLDPRDDDFVRGGSAYEVEGRQRGYSFRAVDTPGVGTVFVALSEDPFVYDRFMLNEHWDFRALEGVEIVGNAEDEFASVVQNMAQGNYFEYDVADYYVETPVEYRARYSRYYYDHDPYYYRWDRFRYRSGFSVGFYFGVSPRYRYHRYRSSWGLFHAWGPYWAHHYDPWYYDPWYFSDPFYYGGWYGPRYYSYPTVYVASGGYRRGYATVNRRYTFKTRSGQPYRVGMRQRTVGGSTIASNVRTSVRRPEPRRAGSAVRRTAPGTAAPINGRRVTPSQRTGTGVATATTVRRTPDRRSGAVTSSGSASRRTTTPVRRSGSETVRRRTTTPLRTAAPTTSGTRRAPAVRSRGATPRASDAVRPARRNRSTTITPSQSSATRRATPSAASRTRTAAPSQSRRVNTTQPTTVRGRSVTPTSQTRLTTSRPSRTATARPATRPTAVRNTRSSTRRSVRPAARSASRPAARPSTRSRPATRSVSRPSTPSRRPVSRPRTSGSRPAARPTRTSSRPAARSSSSRGGSRSSATRTTRRRRPN